MENSEGRLRGTKIVKKTRSLDLQSLYKSRTSEEGLNRRNSVAGDGVEAGKKRKVRKEVSLTNHRQADKKSRRSIDELYRDELCSGSSNDNLQCKLSQKLDSSSGLNSISLNLDGNGEVISIPKRRRGSVGRKKPKSNQILKPPDLPSTRVLGSVNQVVKLNGQCKKFEDSHAFKSSRSSSSKSNSGGRLDELNGDSLATFLSPKVRKSTVDLYANRSSRVKAAIYPKDEDGHLVVNSNGASSRKRQSNHRKRKDLASGSESVAENVISSVDKLIKICDEFPDDDEENLEQNAARMLSSRFDPSCTGFSLKSKSSASPSAQDLPSLTRSGQEIPDQRESYLADLDLASADTASRVLRPRKQSKEKGYSRKRRHFYELLNRDLDAYWVINRRIKVFWPLDESWYYGLVNDYDPERELHHIKYDDRDEEWINLQHERYKLLLLPSEIPDKKEANKYAVDDGDAVKIRRDDVGYAGNHMESEPIITWLASSSRRAKLSSSGVMKKKKTSLVSPKFVPQLSDKSENAHEALHVNSMERDIENPVIPSALSDRLPDAGKGGKSVLESDSSCRHSKSPVVYFRRRLRKKDEGLSQMSEENNACGNTALFDYSLDSHIDSFLAIQETGISCGRFNSGDPWWSTDNGGLFKFTVLLNELNICVPPVLKYAFEVENLRLLNSMLLLQYGIVIPMWPMVHLEILFIDTIFGLRFFLLEGGLRQAVDFISLVLNVFHQRGEQRKCVDQPVTSISLKLSCFRDLRKQYMFTFYCFSQAKHSKWLDLDYKLQSHCLLTRQLPLSECTYDNIQAFEGCSNQLHACSVSRGPSASKGSSHKRCRSADVSKKLSSVNMNQSSSNLDVKQGKFSPSRFSFAAAPSFSLSLHLKMLMDHSIASVSLQDRRVEHAENSGGLVVDDRILAEDDCENASESTSGSNLGTTLEGACSVQKNDNQGKLSLCSGDGNVNNDGTSACSKHSGKSDAVVLSQRCNIAKTQQILPHPLVPKDHVSDTRFSSNVNRMSVEISSSDQVERPSLLRTKSGQLSTDLTWNISDDIVRSPNPTGPRSMWQRSRNSSNISSYGELPYLFPNKRADLIGSGFGNGPRKPRTQVQYTLPLGGYDNSSKDKVHDQKGVSYKRIRIANEKRSLEGSSNIKRNFELLACDANVLITHGERCWRDCGARVVLELADHNEWRLVVKFSGITKYSHKVSHILQPGITNRYTHAMMWKGEKDWVLEFPDRSQWMLFKEMHQECYNRNIRAASVKNIPIPGVRLIEESDDCAAEVQFIRCSPKYFRQVETDADMAMNPTRVLYDMDSDDEQWISENKKLLDTHERKCEEISEDLFEKTMDTFEKVAHGQQRDHFTPDEIEELMVGVGPVELIKVIYEHWRRKRQMKGMPLIRHFQPPLWERYQQQVREWEQAVAKPNTAISNGALPVEKPSMFAFCLKPRGLELPNKGSSKQRSQRKFSLSGHSHVVVGDHDGLHTYGRRSNGFFLGDDRHVFPGNSHESSDGSPSIQTSRTFSPRDAGGPGYFSLSGDGSEWSPHSKLHRKKSKKFGRFLSHNPHTMASYNQRSIFKRNGTGRWNMGLPEWSTQKYYKLEGSQRHDMELGVSELDEFRLRDASGAAQHALNMAKLKREKAQRLLYRADLAINKAVVALMTAEAIKSSFEESNEDG